MTNILVSGLLNIETTLKVSGFPIAYTPERFPFWGVNTTVSGVGFNVARALHKLGNEVTYLTLTGRDFMGQVARAAIKEMALPERYVLPELEASPSSVILYDAEGKRQINCDLKDIQETPYPLELFDEALEACSLAVICNINFARPFLARAQRAGKLIATDIHTIENLEDDYNRDYMAAAGILAMSDEKLPCAAEEWARRVQNRYGTPIIVIGLGAKGALLAVGDDNFMERIPAVTTRPVKNTIGAGDALFSAFVHYYHQTSDPYVALRKATVFASYKIGEDGGANGFLTAGELERLYTQVG